jgi:secreted PhoX family phosphatase
MLNRRRFLQTLGVAAATTRIAGAGTNDHPAFGGLKPDPRGVLDLPEGFTYTIVAATGEEMDDGLLVPGRQDGMAAFPGNDGTIILVCNHELGAHHAQMGRFGIEGQRFELVDAAKVYDAGNGESPGLGGTTTIHYDPKRKRRTHMHMSLMGTAVNCAGGPTPWGSWLTCEECFYDEGTSLEWGHVIHRERKHGYIFEVPANAMEAVEPVPLKDMGRFEHEAAAINPATGIVYLTEDRHESLLYRFIPNVRSELQEGGRLQALAIRSQPAFDTRNWVDPGGMPRDKWFECAWVDLEEPDVSSNDLRHQGREIGAAIFARGEGITWADGEVVMAATIGGPERLGQIFTYLPSPVEGTAHEASQPGRLRLFAQSNSDSVLRHADNLKLSPWGDIIVCEDTADHCGLVGISPDGRQYPLADNAYTQSELAGICFSPDGAIMFVNIQHRGLTLAITGPWRT